MKIGINCKWNLIVEDGAVDKLRKARVKAVEVSYKEKKYIPKGEIEILKNLKFDYSVHAPYENIKMKAFPWPRYSKKSIKEIEDSLDNAIELGASHFVVHGGTFLRGYYRFRNLIRRDYGLKFSLNRFIKNFEPIFKRANDNDIKAVVENLYPCFICGRASDIKYIQEKLPFVGFCLDFAHSEIYNQTDDLMKLKIEHVHVSDNNKKEDQHLRIGNGVMNFNALLSKLKMLNYKGKIIIECNNLEDGIYSFKRLNNILIN